MILYEVVLVWILALILWILALIFCILVLYISTVGLLYLLQYLS